MTAIFHGNKSPGFTLIELMFAIAIFGIVMAFFYPSFEHVKNKVSELNDKQELMQRGQRAADFIGEELRLTGLFVGDVPMPGLNMCNTPGISTIMHTEGAPSDTVQILTSERITTTVSGKPFLNTNANAAKHDTTVIVNASNAAAPAIHPYGGTDKNARSFITFDTLQPNLGTLVYQVTGYVGSLLTLDPALDQQINSQSNAYAVVRKRFSVDNNRNLMLVRWDADCDSNGASTEAIVSSWGPGNNNGGVDGFQVEYTLANGAPVDDLQTSDIVNVRSITAWILLRVDFPTKGYTDTNVYRLGNVVLGPFNDGYRRAVATRTVEVKNAGL